MTTLLVIVISLNVISLALDVLILASLGNLIAQLFGPRKCSKATEEAIRKAIVESVNAMHAQAARIPKYDA